MNTVLTVESLSKSFDGNLVLDNLNFQMDRASVFGLIGTNGAGKTTAIRCILGIMTADSGRASWGAETINRETLGFGYMPEERGLYMKSKVLNQLVYFAMLRGMNKEEGKQSALEYLRRLKIEEYKDMMVEKLSKGNQQKVQLIATIIHKPKLVFLDEPFSGLDPVNTEALRNLIGDLVAEGTYIVMSSHQMNVVEDYCQDIALLHQGKTILAGNLRDIKKSFGHTNLLVSASEKANEIAKNKGLQLIEKRAEEDEYLITGDEMAQDFLQSLMGSGVFPIKYQIKEPSLHEIFLRKVGDNK